MPIPNMNMSSPEIFFPEVQDGVSYGDLWSLFLPARTPVTTVPEALIRLTNVALDEDIQGPDSRTVLRVTWPDPQCPEKTLNSVLCSLGDGLEQYPIKMTLKQGRTYTFMANGPNNIYLTGSYLNAPTTFTSTPPQTPLRSTKRCSPIEIEYAIAQPPTKRVQMSPPTPTSQKRQPRAVAMVGEIQPAKAPSTEKAASSKGKVASNKGKSKAVERSGKQPMVVIKEGSVGDGETVELGDEIEFFFSLRLRDGTTIQNHESTPHTICVGNHDVIKGWDDNIAGMKVGGQRQLTIPPELGYGDSPVGKIPANSTVVVDFMIVAAIHK
ncbi:hypothetical protein K443DRAFT_682735 [Laccaria amethystina LaAM-08-1]|uniref:peptidylprolyl isomerase n=1 Tax=Laccaria amethystina LaAM-08-1 TaxID=1095629 RepID=A0A0C9XI15_9AGAR|nr:hypothetical protein K443DRAFT_682735 [Laccaria amethystina LaAM-08-1]